jgi:NTE family protein
VAEASRKALVLPGAGARGAYQVGVLKAIASMLGDKAPNPFSIISGTSAGAINAAVLASRAEAFVWAVAEMEQVWANFTADQVYRTDNWTMLKSSLHWLAAIVLGGLGVRNPQALLDPSPLRGLLARNIPFAHIERSISRGDLGALAVTASAYSSARSVTFFQASETVRPWVRVRRIGRPARITLDHLMASAAVPFVFPPVRIGGEYYGDGSMRLGAPLSSAIHLGAERILVVGVRDEHLDPEPSVERPADAPSLAHLAGYLLDTLFMDGVYADIERLTRINLIVDQLAGQGLSGPVSDLRSVHALVLVPERDLREVAERHVDELPRALRLLLRGLGAMNRRGMQLISYLLFESGFTRELIDLGFHDAMERESEIRVFLSDAPMDTLDAPQHIKEGLLLG